ncbi:MAG: glycogen debranching enzyme family protein [Planctomycetes bacterium]|nr:glycogen debranching enzyme family protein [Planctomycetota bacterium]
MASAKSPAGPPADRGQPPRGPTTDPSAEWLLTDGAGGYACGTAADLPTRRYHGLWVARAEGSAQRWSVVAGLDERIADEAQGTILMHAHWASLPEASPPAADVTFEHRPLPRWRFRAGAHVVERTVALRQTSDDHDPALLVRWTNAGRRPLRLLVRPLLGWCNADHLPRADDRFDATVHSRGASWGIRPNEALPMLWLSVDGVAAFRGESAWYRGFLFATDRDRGYDHVGDRWSPGVLEVDLAPGQSATAAFAFADPCGDPTSDFAVAAAAADAAFVASQRTKDSLRARLALGADDFLYRAVAGRRGVLAGFPWFGEWGRDVFVSLPGLTLARGRLAECALVLGGALPFLRGGLLPNVYGASIDDSHYGSCDAALWFALAVVRYAAAGGDEARIKGEYLPALRSIADAYMKGTGLGLAVDGEGLLRAGRPDLNATWMDARTSRGPVTPRDGLPVEIQALWYSLLAFLVERGEARFAAARDRCGAMFVQAFWLAEGEYLADRVRNGAPDRTVRPNMVVAAALPHSPLSTAQRAGVVGKARAELLTPRGLRTLSPRDPAYRPRYEGGVEQRDGSYHQGTVWPWLGGFFVEASLRAAAKTQQADVRAELRSWLDGFLPELDRAGLDHVSEVFDGDAPHRPGGTFAQAWNTGELLRALAMLDAPAAAVATRRSGETA